jgi:hypothetical protein
MNRNSKRCTVDQIFVHADTAVGTEPYLNFYIQIRVLISWRPCAFTCTKKKQSSILAPFSDVYKTYGGGGGHEHLGKFNVVARFAAS